MSDGSTLVPDPYARCLRRALDQKVRKLRSVLIGDEDITTEFDHVVCRLMKLALHTSTGRNAPPPTRWMQCKLLDLLTLTEKSIERRKKHFIENYSLNANNCDKKSEEVLKKIKEDTTASRIVDKYKHLVKQPNGMQESLEEYQFDDLELDLDNLSVSSADFAKDYVYVDRQYPSFFGLAPGLPDPNLFDPKRDMPQGESKLERTQAWVEEDIEVVPYPSHDVNFDNSSVETDNNTTKYIKKEVNKCIELNCVNSSVETDNNTTKYIKKEVNKCIELNCVVCKKARSKRFKQNGTQVRMNKDSKKMKYRKNASRKMSSNSSLGLNTHNKFVSVDHKAKSTHKVKSRRKHHKSLNPTASQPIPASFRDLCQPELMIGNDMGSYNDSTTDGKAGKGMMTEQLKPEADTKESLVIGIITEDAPETIALRGTIGTEVVDPISFEEETLIRSVSNTLMNEDNLFEKHNVATGNVNSQTIFLYDIDEPTTSKGIRHSSMDAQCGPDAVVPTYSMLSATTSLTRVPKMFTAGIKIGESTTDTNIKSAERSTCTYDIDDTNSYKTIIPRERFVGIKIQDSYSNMKPTEFSTVLAYSMQRNVQCTTSLTRIPNKITTILKIGHSTTDMNIKNTDCSTCTNNVHDSYNHILPRESSTGVAIKYITSNTIKKLNFGAVRANSTVSATTSLTRVPQIFTEGIKIRGSITDTKIKSTDCNTCCNDANDNYKTVLPREQCAGIETNDSCSDIIMKMKLSTVPAFSILSGTKSLTTILKAATEEVEIKRINRGTCANDGENTIKSFLPIEKCIDVKINDFKTESLTVSAYTMLSATTSLTIMPRQIEFSTNTQEYIDKIDTSSRQTLAKKIKLLKFKPKEKSNCYKTKVFSATPPKQMECLRSNQVHHKRSNVSSPRPISNETALKSLTKLKSVNFKVKNSGSNMPKNNKLNANHLPPPPYFKETNLLKLSTGMKTTVRSISDFIVSADSFAKSPSLDKNTLENNDLQIMSPDQKVVPIPEQPPSKYVKTKLCNGGLQVHSYRDNNISEDIMYQGKWQAKRPKTLAKNKLMIPVPLKKNNYSNLKRKARSKENIQFKNSAKWTDKPEARSLLPRKLVNLKQESDKTEIKLNRKIPLTAVKTKEPFRNVLKVPSKITMSCMPSKKPKTACNVKKPSINPNLTVTKDEKFPRKLANRSYIPLYLRQKALILASDVNKVAFNLSLNSAKSINQTNNLDIKASKEKAPKTLTRSKTEDIKRDLLQFHTGAPIPNYVVLRNEIDNKSSSDGEQINNISDSANKLNNSSRPRSVSPITSRNSSSCSSPSSIATVKAVSVRPKNVTSQRHSFTTSSNKNNSRSESPTHERIKKFTKRSRSAKTTADRVSDNKENISQTSKQFNDAKKQNDKFGKRSFIGQKKDVYIAHLKESPPLQLAMNTLSKHKTQKSNINIPKADSISQKRSLHIRSRSPSEKASLKSDIPLPTNSKNEVSATSQTSNMVLVIEPQARGLQSLTGTPKSGNVNVVNHPLVTNCLDNPVKGAVESHTSNIMSAMREFIDEALDFIVETLDKCNNDSETVILSGENLTSRIESVSPRSFKTTISDNENINGKLVGDIEFALNRSFDTTLGNVSILSLEDTRLTVTDFDVQSFKSIGSTSKISAYLSAENELSSVDKIHTYPRNSTPVRDIFERRDQPFQPAQIQNTPALAHQAFSGFSINGDAVPGDQPDFMNFMDSETGSLTLDVGRQATSEELLISGRSSDSYQSCLMDDDVVVPNWLFQIISQQQSAMDESESAAELTAPLSLPEPMFDDNGNMLEGPVAGAGAGDGRGIHSDQSQDSSGRGTSVSSSDMSSGQTSEAIIIDPSAFVAQFELLREAVEASVVSAINNTSENNAIASRQAPIEAESGIFSRGESRRVPRAHLATASDIDADISSLETDADALDDSDN